MLCCHAARTGTDELVGRVQLRLRRRRGPAAPTAAARSPSSASSWPTSRRRRPGCDAQGSRPPGAGQVPGRGGTPLRGLEMVADALRAAIDSARGEVDQALTEVSEARVGAAFRADPGTRRAPGTATEELARQRAAEPATTLPRQPARSWPRSSARPRNVAAEAHRCDPADLQLLQGLLAELRTLTSRRPLASRPFRSGRWSPSRSDGATASTRPPSSAPGCAPWSRRRCPRTASASVP